jgi:transcription elongation factor Elf1
LGEFITVGVDILLIIMKKGKNQETGTCLICGKSFQYYPSEKNGKYCSLECYHKSRGEIVKLICGHCGKVFERQASRVKSIPSFCSTECRLANKRNLVEITCKICGKMFSWRASRLKYYATECCSKKCAGIARRNRMKKVCKCCGKEFDIKESATTRDVERGIYCSFECYHTFSKGKNSHMYDHGQSFYPYCEKFDDGLKERVRWFFSGKCVICGKTSEENHKKRLDVHHVYIEKLSCCETKIEDMDLVRARLPRGVARFGQPEFSSDEIVYIRMMVPMCIADHARVHMTEQNDIFYEDTFYRKQFTELIMNTYGGKCYFTKEEFKNKMG